MKRAWNNVKDFAGSLLVICGVCVVAIVIKLALEGLLSPLFNAVAALPEPARSTGENVLLVGSVCCLFGLWCGHKIYWKLKEWYCAASKRSNKK